VISPIVQAEDEENSTQNNDEKEKRKYSPGLTMSDIWSIRNQVKTVENISPEISMNSFVVQNGIRESAKIVGVSANYFDIYNLMLESGKVFTAYQEKNGLPVCIIGANIRSKFFSKIDPLDQYIKFGSVWLKVIGVIEKSNISLTGFENAGVNVFNDNIYIPAKTMLLRFQNRALFTSGKLKGEARDHLGRSIIPSENVSSNYHQLDKIIVQVTSSEMMAPTAEILSRLMFRKHLEVKDYEIRLPELELKQEQRTKDIFNVVLGAIAGIALVVGGIGIMNIMFASVMERIKEIGTRLAIGAKKSDIVVQFLSEAILISVIGGILGVIIGIILAKIINHVFDILTIITPFSVLVAFGVSATIGIIFGYAPAKRASEKDPIESLRYE
jgi:putative ABC transport system permease protein